jgi:hypothetical protein
VATDAPGNKNPAELSTDIGLPVALFLTGLICKVAAVKWVNIFSTQ